MFEDLQQGVLGEFADAQAMASDEFVGSLMLELRSEKRREYKAGWERAKRPNQPVRMCPVCGAVIPQKKGGRPQLFCNDAHRKKHSRNLESVRKRMDT